jgi:hypothetical protein
MDAQMERRIASLEARLAQAETRLQRQEDIEAIKRLQRAYGYYLDKNLYRAVADLFTDDGEIEIAARGVYKGRERIYEFLLRLLGKGIDGPVYGHVGNHFQLQAIVSLDEGGYTAKARWRAWVQVGDLDGAANWLEGPYEIEYLKEGGVWKIASLVWFPSFTTPYADGWAKSFLQPSQESTEMPPDRKQTHDGKTAPEPWVMPFHFVHPVTGAKVEWTEASRA